MKQEGGVRDTSEQQQNKTLLTGNIQLVSFLQPFSNEDMKDIYMHTLFVIWQFKQMNKSYRCLWFIKTYLLAYTFISQSYNNAAYCTFLVWWNLLDKGHVAYFHLQIVMIWT